MLFRAIFLFTLLNCSSSFAQLEARSDSLGKVIEELGFHECSFDRRSCLPGEEPANFFTFNDKVGKRKAVSSDSVRISWHLPKGESYEGQYYLVIQTMFDEYLDIIVTSNQYADIIFSKYRAFYDGDFLLIQVTKEECEKSEKIALEKI